MLRVSVFLTSLLLAPPILAQEGSSPSDDAPGLMQRGLDMFLDGLREEMAPTLEDMEDMARDFGPQMRAFMKKMGPALSQLLEDVEDWTFYEAPEILPNGDIIIRKKRDPAELETAPSPEEESGAIDI